jgi:hypothetical protein
MALLTALDSWMGSVDEGKFVGALMLDLSKAFDCVPHPLLLHELSKIGVGTLALDWFCSYLSGRTQRVCHNEDITKWRSIGRGVPQGSCLSPLLFNIFVRNIPLAADADCVQFADDITESVVDKDIDAMAKKLTSSFNGVKQFCDHCDLVVNAAKTQLIVFKSANKKLPDEFKLILDNCEIKPSRTAKLLGVTIDCHFTMGDHIEATVRKCQGTLGVLRRAAPNMPIAMLRLAYIAIVRTHLEYASAVFAPSSRTQLEKLDVIQRIAARIILSLPRDAHAAPLLDALSLPSLESRRKEHIANLVESALARRCHPTLNSFFRTTDAGEATGDCIPRIAVGRKRFRYHGALVYNERQNGNASRGILGP